MWQLRLKGEVGVKGRVFVICLKMEISKHGYLLITANRGRGRRYPNEKSRGDSDGHR